MWNRINEVASKLPQPVYNALFNFLWKFVSELVAGKPVDEAYKNSEEQLVDLRNVQDLYHERAEKKFPGYSKEPPKS